MTTTAVNVALEKCPAELSAEHLDRFAADGYLAFAGFLSPGEVSSLNAALREMLAALLERGRSGELPVKRGNWEGMRNYSGYKIEDPKTQLSVLVEPSVELDIQKTSLDELDAIYRKVSFCSRGHKRFKELAEDPRLIRMLEGLIGPSPIMFADQALCKPAKIGTDKPWHQDSAYFTYEPFGHGVDVWIALDDTTVENGCMIMLPGGHKIGPKKHVHLTDCTIDPGRVDYSAAIPVEMKAGSILLFSPMTPHYTPPNTSEKRRRAAQLFYRAAHTRLITPDEHSRNFVEADGTPATCAAAAKAEKIVADR